jgi:cephalosporin-C deacetylase-like acetyl esterase
LILDLGRWFVKELPDVSALTRRDFLRIGITAPAALASAAAPAAEAAPLDIHRQLLELAAHQEHERRDRFLAVKSKANLEVLQTTLRQTFLRLLDGLPARTGPPPVRMTGRIEADDHIVEKLLLESLPGFFVPALLYKPKRVTARLPGVLSPCGHSTTGKAAEPYQILHVNLARRGYAVLTYDPVGQGERSQFWDAANGRSRFNLSCGEHAVLGNPLYLLGTSLARYRVFDGMRGIDYLASLPEVDASRIGCVGNSGGGTLTAYIAALDHRVAVAAICCYITTLRRHMGNRIQEDPDADPEQDIFGFMSELIDHPGLLAMRAPKPTLLGAARFDFFPIEGTRESFAEAKRLYEIAGARESIQRVEAPERHGLSLPIRKAVYDWFERWLAGRRDPTPTEEFPVAPRPARDLLVCEDGQVNGSVRSRPLLPLALEQFERAKKPRKHTLADLLRLDFEMADYRITEVAPGHNRRQTIVICVNGNESADWQQERTFLGVLERHGYTIVAVDPRGVGKLRPDLAVKGRGYSDPLAGVEENLAYNAFLVGKSLLGMRTADVLAAVRKLLVQTKPKRVVLCGRRDAALLAALAAAALPAINYVAVEDLLPSYRSLFGAEGRPINAASILPGVLQRFGDVADVLAQVAPRKVLVAASGGDSFASVQSVSVLNRRFTQDANVLIDWLGD